MSPQPSQSGRLSAVVAALGCALLFPAGPADAEDRPPAQPTRDAAVTYSGMPGAPLQMSWLAAGHLSRSDIAPGIWSLHDEAKHVTIVVNDAEKAVIAMPMPDPMQLSLAPNASFTREGTDTVAGTACTVWGIHAQGMDAKACITMDGVTLRMDAMGMLLTATAVSYAAQNAARFQVPAGYSREATP